MPVYRFGSAQDRFRSLVWTALCAGLISGLLLTVIQYLQLVPLIEQAEQYEVLEPHRTDHADHTQGAWQPSPGWPRFVATLGANMAVAVGFALLLAGIFSLKGQFVWFRGALWGMAGFGVFFLMPALLVPPTIPGIDAASLAQRQLLWIIAVVCAALGLLWLLWGRHPWRWLGIVVALTPVFIFRDLTFAYAHPALIDIHRQFIAASYLSNGIFWIVLGIFCAVFLRKFYPVATSTSAS